MARSARQCLVEALEDLGRGEFDTFKADLREVQVQGQFKRIPWGKLENADKLSTAKLMVDHYRDGYAVEIAVSVLRGMGQHSTADELQSTFQTAPQAAAPAPAPQAAAPAPVPRAGAPLTASTQALHPVDQYFTRIIQGFNSVDAILDSLLVTSVITSEHYDSIRSNPTKQEKMRALLIIIRGRGPTAKTSLWDAMKEVDPFFIQSLTS